jgi:glycosyltransferase involved in cell wall biosynthesis
LPEVIVHEETGFLCDPSDVACMTAIVLGLFRNEELRRAIGRAGRERAVAQFNREKIVARYVQSYERLVNGG